MNDKNEETNGTGKDWDKSKLFVMNELNRHAKCLDSVGEKLDQIICTLNEMKVNEAKFSTEFKIKSGIWGLIGGAIVIIAELLLHILKTKL